MEEKLKSIIVKDIPKDVYAEIMRVQSEHKAKHVTQFSLGAAMIKIVKGTIKEKKDANS